MRRESVTSAAMYVGGFVAFGCGVPDYREVNELYADSDGGAMRWRFCEPGAFPSSARVRTVSHTPNRPVSHRVANVVAVRLERSSH